MAIWFARESSANNTLNAAGDSSVSESRSRMVALAPVTEVASASRGVRG